MITPHKYLNLDLSILRISSIILKFLLQDNLILYNEVIYRLRQVEPQISMETILISINFLYLFGVIEFDAQKDMFKLVQ